MSEIERFMDKVSPEPNSGCWLWCGGDNGRGYGTFRVGKSREYAHRFSYKHFIGTIPDGKEIDHKCSVRSCVNPDHLEAVTHLENVRRGTGGIVAAKKQLKKTHCPKGHPYDGDNLYLTKEGWRCCRICLRARNGQ